MGSLDKREWEIYNFEQMGASTEYDNILINKDIDNYFNELISKPVLNKNTFIPKSNYNFEQFYLDYIEHNLLFIVLLIGIIIFLIIRYYIKDFDTFDSVNNTGTNVNKDDDLITNNASIDSDDNMKNNKSNKSNKPNKLNKLNKLKKQQIEKIKLINYKKKLDQEKEKILSIIDELSNINQYESTKSKPNPVYLNQDINVQYGTNYSNNSKFFNQSNNDLESIPHNLDDNSEYYNISKDNYDETNKIDGLYIEPPFN